MPTKLAAMEDVRLHCLDYAKHRRAAALLGRPPATLVDFTRIRKGNALLYRRAGALMRQVQTIERDDLRIELRLFAREFLLALHQR